MAPAARAPCTATGLGAGGVSTDGGGVGTADVVGATRLAGVDAGIEAGNLKYARFLRTLSISSPRLWRPSCSSIRYDVTVARSPIDPTGGNLRARRSGCRRYENVPRG